MHLSMDRQMPAAPAAGSVCPSIFFTALNPRTSRPEGSRPSESTVAAAPTSIGSPSGVPVPCISRAASPEGNTSASCSASFITCDGAKCQSLSPLMSISMLRCCKVCEFVESTNFARATQGSFTGTLPSCANGKANCEAVSRNYHECTLVKECKWLATLNLDVSSSTRICRTSSNGFVSSKASEQDQRCVGSSKGTCLLLGGSIWSRQRRRAPILVDGCPKDNTGSTLCILCLPQGQAHGHHSLAPHIPVHASAIRPALVAQAHSICHPLSDIH